MAYDTVELESTAGGGAKVLGDTFTDTDSNVKFVAGGFLVYGSEDGPYTRVTASVGLPIADAGGSLTVDSTDITAAAASLAILDDWDESDRAKVNPIAGQAGVQGGSGAVSALTQRVVLATDVALPTGTNSIGQVTANAGTNLNTSLLALEAGNLATIATDTTAASGFLANIDTNIVTCNTGAVVLAAGTANIGDVDVLTVPADPFGANADAASATGSISAKLRFIASTGIPITGTVTVGTHAVTQSGTWTVTGSGGTFPVTDSGGSLTVDAPVGTPVFVRLSDGSSAISTLPVSLASVPSHAVTNAGTFAVQVDGSALTSLQLLDDAVATTGSAITAKGFTACGTDGTNARALKTDSSGELQVDVLSVPALAAGTNTIGGVTPVAATSGGATPYKLVSAASTNATSVKASAGQIYSLQVFNTNASARYLKLYDKASSPTVGTDTPVKVITIPGATTGAGATMQFPVGIVFSSGIALATTTGASDSDSTGVAASEIIINLDYK